MEMVKDALDQLRGAVMIVYPMGLPPYDPIRMEFENKEDLSGTQVCGSQAFCKVGPPLAGALCPILSLGEDSGVALLGEGPQKGRQEGCEAAYQEELKTFPFSLAAGRPGTSFVPVSTQNVLVTLHGILCSSFTFCFLLFSCLYVPFSLVFLIYSLSSWAVPWI